MSLILTHGANSLSHAITPIIPQDCVILDYFEPNYRYGIASINDRYSHIEYVDQSELGFTKGVCGTNIPVAVFDSTDYNTSWNVLSEISYDFTNIDAPVGLTVEYWMKMAINSNWVSDATSLQNSTFKIMHSYNAGIMFGYSNASGSWSWGTSNRSVITGSSGWADWNHIAYTWWKDTGKLMLFINGYPCPDDGNGWYYMYGSGPTGLSLRPCVHDSNYPSEREGSYKLTQLAVWNYPKYTETFTVPNSPYI
jgi:hypothetical protein